MNQFDFQSRGGCRYQPDRRDPLLGFMAGVAGTAVGVFVGVVLALITYQHVVVWRLESAAKQFRDDMRDEFKP